MTWIRSFLHRRRQRQEARRQALFLAPHLQRARLLQALSFELAMSLAPLAPEVVEALRRRHRPAAPAVLRLTASTARRMDRMGKSLFGPERWGRWLRLVGAHLLHAFLLVSFHGLQKREPRWPTSGGETG